MRSTTALILAEWKLMLIGLDIYEQLKYEILFWVRYVHDIFAIVNLEPDTNVILKSLNKIDQNIQFTMEQELKTYRGPSTTRLFVRIQ